MTRRVWFVAIAAVVCLATFAVWSGQSEQPHELLRDVYSPAFVPMPDMAPFGQTIASIRSDLQSPAGHDFIRRLLPDQAAALWIMLAVIGVVAFDFSRLRASRNLDLLVAFALGLTLFDVLVFARMRMTPDAFGRLDLVFTLVVACNVALIARAVWRARAGGAAAWLPNLTGRPLAALALALVVGNVAVGLVRDPDDAGYFTNLGAQRFRERGRLPYGDPLLTGTPGAAYGPILYAAHVPFQLLVEPRSPNATSPSRPLLGVDATYYLPSPVATKLTTITLHLAGLLALWVATRRLAGADMAWALVALYASSAFVLGVGGDRELIGGITFISHIGPAALTLMAFVCLSAPAWAGALLAAAAGAGFYPAFMFPAWAAHYWGDRQALRRFLVGFALAAAVIGGGTLALSRPAGGRGLVGTILADTFGHHTDPEGYGRSPFGFWGQRGGVRSWMVTPLVGASGLTTPAYGLFFGLVAATVVIGRNSSPVRLAALSAAVALAASTIKIHSSGTYVAWAYPLVLISLLPERAEERAVGR